MALFGSYQNKAAARPNPLHLKQTSTELLVLSAWLRPCTAGGRKPCLIPSVLLQISIFPLEGDLKITATARVSVDNELLLYPHGGFSSAQQSLLWLKPLFSSGSREYCAVLVTTAATLKSVSWFFGFVYSFFFFFLQVTDSFEWIVLAFSFKMHKQKLYCD